MNTRILTKEELRDIKVGAIARKHRCSTDYVRKILIGDRNRDSELSKVIVKDAVDMIEIIERNTKLIV